METIERKLDQGSQHRRSILVAFANSDESELNTSILRERGDVPTGSANHHLVTLEKWELIEVRESESTALAVAARLGSGD